METPLPTSTHLLTLKQPLRIINSNLSHPLQNRPIIRLPKSLPPIQPLLSPNTQTLIPTLNNLRDLPRRNRLPLPLLLQQTVIMPAHTNQRLHGRILREVIRVAEFREDVAGFDELVEEVVVGGCVGEEGFAGREGERDQVYEGVY